ncbi:hypothetical protein PUN28_004825 [Cardiocondyla obscurior]|uniref:Uncharacterized protein n=1 Tax=Cardiocondyla obscurior TaxID=286306 RepID=A0AAW2GEL0_9HYME
MVIRFSQSRYVKMYHLAANYSSCTIPVFRPAISFENVFNSRYLYTVVYIGYTRISNTARPSVREHLMDSGEIILAEYQMSGKDSPGFGIGRREIATTFTKLQSRDNQCNCGTVTAFFTLSSLSTLSTCLYAQLSFSLRNINNLNR